MKKDIKIVLNTVKKKEILGLLSRIPPARKEEYGGVQVGTPTIVEENPSVEGKYVWYVGIGHIFEGTYGTRRACWNWFQFHTLPNGQCMVEGKLGASSGTL